MHWNNQSNHSILNIKPNDQVTTHYSANTNRNSLVAQRERYQCLHAVSLVRDVYESEMNWAQRVKEKGKQNLLHFSYV